MVSVLSTIVTEIKKVLHQEGKPIGAHNMLVKDIKNGMKVQIRVAQKDFLEICLRKDLFTKDILSITKSLTGNDDKSSRKKLEEFLRIDL